MDHYENPRNVGSLDKNDPNVGTGLVGAPACGDVMKLQIKVDADGKIVESKFKTFGCGSAIASSSVATEWLKGKTVDECLTVSFIRIVIGANVSLLFGYWVNVLRLQSAKSRRDVTPGNLTFTLAVAHICCSVNPAQV